MHRVISWILIVAFVLVIPIGFYSIHAARTHDAFGMALSHDLAGFMVGLVLLCAVATGVLAWLHKRS